MELIGGIGTGAAYAGRTAVDALVRAVTVDVEPARGVGAGAAIGGTAAEYALGLIVQALVEPVGGVGAGAAIGGAAAVFTFAVRPEKPRAEEAEGGKERPARRLSA